MSVSTTTSECGQNSSGQRTVYSLCGMCAVRCPLAVTVKDGAVAWIQGNPNDPALGASLCAKGGAGQSFQQDDERPHSPLIRTGARGAGQWRRASWDEALTYIADKVQETIAEFGTRGIALSDRGGPFTDLTRTFTQALGSPNYVNHDASCASNVYNAARSLFGFPHSRLVLDLKRAKHLVLYGRNIAESLMVKEAKSFMAAVANGLQVTYIDPRATITASKASRYWQIRPNSDYALNLALIHEILRLELYDKEFVARHVTGLEELRAAVATTTPDWQVEHTGISAAAVRELVQDIAAAAPQVIFHPGWMTARHKQSFYVSRSALILNVLMGNLEVPGGLLLAKTPEQCGRASLKRLQDRCEKVSTPRADGAGDVHPSWDPAIGVLHQLYAAMETAQPYGIGAYFIYRHDPLTAMPDAEAIKRAFDHLKLIVAIDVRYSETAWYADVILPESTFLERANILGQVQGAVPSLIMRDQAVTPRFDSRPAWWIFREILRRLGRGAALDFEDIEDIWEYQLEGVGVTVAEMRSQGVVTLAEIPPTARSQIPPTPLFQRGAQIPDLPPLEKGGRGGLMRSAPLTFPTPSGKIELTSALLTQAGLPSVPPYVAKTAPSGAEFYLLFGRAATLTHGQSLNNPLLHEIAPAQELWIHPDRAAALGIADGALVEINGGGAYSGQLRAKVTLWIHPETVFMLHGYGATVPAATRAVGFGVADQRLQHGKLYEFDPAGGGCALTETIVHVRPVAAAGGVA